MSMNVANSPKDFEPKKAVITHNTSTNAVKGNYHNYKLNMAGKNKIKMRAGSKPGTSKRGFASTKRSTNKSFLSQSVAYSTNKL